MSLPPLKQHQLNGIAAVGAMRLSKPGEPLLGVAPPGAGKSRVMVELAAQEVRRGGRVVIKAHRKMLVDQLLTGFQDAGLPCSVISTEHINDASEPIQIASTQTLYSRAVKRGTIDLPDATLVINDEAHQQAGEMEKALLHGSFTDGTLQQGYLAKGADVVGFTATPMMSTPIYKHIINFGSYSELRKAGMHQWVRVYDPEEIDTRGLTKQINGEYSPSALSKRAHTIIGSVYDNWKRLNPQALPAILFAPSKASSRWFAEEFFRRGTPVAHIDGEMVLIPEGGRLVQYPTSSEVRAEILEMSRTGAVKCVMNRFVLREAIDMPWLYHGIFATVMGSLTTALQSVGRLQRFWPEYESKLLQDHGGFYYRHGSPNMDRTWDVDLTQSSVQQARIERIKRGEESEGIRCPKCGHWRTKGAQCVNPECKHQHTASVRVVRQLNGRLVEIKGPVFTGENAKPDADKLWFRCLFQMAYMGRPVSSAVALFTKRARESGVTVDLESLRCSPPDRSSVKWDMKVTDVYPWTAQKRKAVSR